MWDASLLTKKKNLFCFFFEVVQKGSLWKKRKSMLSFREQQGVMGSKP